MSLDGGGVSNGPGAQETASAMEEDYCLHGRERFHGQWASTGVFHAGALRLYGITGELVLLRSIKQTCMLGATFGTCFLGRFPVQAGMQNSTAPSPPFAAAVAEEKKDEELPFSTLLLGPIQPPEFQSNPQLAQQVWRREVMSSWDALQMPSQWCQTMNGVVTEANWTTQEQRQRIQAQLELASFMCLRAVQVPLPFYAAGLPWAADDGDEDEGNDTQSHGDRVQHEKGVAAAARVEAESGPQDTEQLSMTLSPEDDAQRNTRLACLAADILLAFIQQSTNVKVWVRCDGCNPVHRYQMQRLRQAVLYGYTRHRTADHRWVYHINTPCSVTGSCRVAAASFSSSSSHADVASADYGGSGSGVVHTEAVSALTTMLYFSTWHPRMLLPSEWFGEQVVCFECPPAPLLFACLAPHGVMPQQHPHYRPDAARETTVAGAAAAADTSGLESFALVDREGEGEREEVLTMEEDATPPRPYPVAPHNRHHSRVTPSRHVPFDVSTRSSPVHLPELEERNDNEADRSALLSATDYSLGDWNEERTAETQRTPGEASAPSSSAAAVAAATTATGAATSNDYPSATSTPYPHNDAADDDDAAEATNTQCSDVLHRRYEYAMPQDLHPLAVARWAGGYPPFVSVLTFLVEMLRRRAMPLFDRSFFDQYPLLNYLHFKAVEESTRDSFASFEDQLQLPIQPLGHQLSSGVYEVFERDARKYRQYHEAVFSYVKDWFEAGPARQHALQNEAFFAQHGVTRQVPVPSLDERVLYLVLLGCGRGPLIDECLNAVSALGVRLRLFAIEKNGPAAAFTRMRWANDPEWAQLAYNFGHTLEVIVADGRHIARAARDGSVVLPPDFGLCDVVVSELLGSLGDNELSPECIEGFHAQLLEIQQSRGLQRNAHLTCIPQQYTAWVAPLMSASLEAAVAAAAVKGLTVTPPQCPDRHAALNHSLLVTNLSRGVTLAEPQACWTFTHDFGEHQKASLHSRAATSAAVPPESVVCDDGSCTTATPTAASPLDRSAHLVFTVPPSGRCSGLAGYFSCVLYQSPTSPTAAVTLSTAPEQRTADMYSWFPCTFTLDPTQRRELCEVEAAAATKTGVVALHVDLARKTSVARRQVWYEWSVRYCDADEMPTESAATVVVVHNRDGWASSILL